MYISINKYDTYYVKKEMTSEVLYILESEWVLILGGEFFLSTNKIINITHKQTHANQIPKFEVNNHIKYLA